MQNPLEAPELLGDLVTRRGFEYTMEKPRPAGGFQAATGSLIEWVRIPSDHRNEKRPPPKAMTSFCLVTRRGFEPRTHCLKGSCSAN